METNNDITKLNQNRMIHEAIKKIALGRSFERINMAPNGLGGVGTARMIHGYVAKIHDDPTDEEYEYYAGTIDVGEFPDETASTEPIIHKGVLLSGLKDNANGFLIIPTLFSDITIVSDAATKYTYVLNYSHANIIQLDSHFETSIGVTETEELDPEDNDSPDYDELEKTGNSSSTKYTLDTIHSVVKSKDGKETSIKMSPEDIIHKVVEALITHNAEKIQLDVSGTNLTVSCEKITIGGEDATEPLVLGNELAQLMLDFLTECSKITTPTLIGTMPALNIPNFISLTGRIEKFLSKTAFTK